MLSLGSLDSDFLTRGWFPIGPSESFLKQFCFRKQIYTPLLLPPVDLCLYMFSMLGTYSDEFGKLDFERSQHGSGMSNRSQAKRFVSALNSIAERTYNNLFDLQQLRQIAKELQIRVSLETKHFFNNKLQYQSKLLIANGNQKRHICCASAINRNKQCLLVLG